MEKRCSGKCGKSRNSKNTPVIVLTNAGDVDSMREVKFYGNAGSFLIKANVTPQDVVDTVKTFG